MRKTTSSQGSISSNLSAQRKAKIRWSTTAQQVGQHFFYWYLACYFYFVYLGSAPEKAACMQVDEIEPRSNSHLTPNESELSRKTILGSSLQFFVLSLFLSIEQKGFMKRMHSMLDVQLDSLHWSLNETKTDMKKNNTRRSSSRTEVLNLLSHKFWYVTHF